MFKIFTLIDYALKAKQGMEKPEDLLAETSFAFLEIYFYVSFAFLGLFTFCLWCFVIYFLSVIGGVFATLFSLALAFDIFIFIKVKRFFERMSKKIVDYGKDQFIQTRIIEVDIIEE